MLMMLWIVQFLRGKVDITPVFRKARWGLVLLAAGLIWACNVCHCHPSGYMRFRPKPTPYALQRRWSQARSRCAHGLSLYLGHHRRRIVFCGLAKRPAAKQLHVAVRELLRRVDGLPWDNAAAELYGTVRADMSRQGKILTPLTC
jgi:hypothetical protein